MISEIDGGDGDRKDGCDQSLEQKAAGEACVEQEEPARMPALRWDRAGAERTRARR